METKRTWSRELSLLLIVALGLLAYFDKNDSLEILVWPFMIFVTAAFGLKQEAVVGFLNK